MFKFAALLVITPLVIAGCSSSGGGGGGNTSSPPVSSPPASTPPASTPAAAETVTAAQAKATLLTVQDVGPGFSSAQFQPSQDPLPCKPNDPPLEQQFPSTLEVGAAFIRNGNGAALGEDLRYYADTATATQVLNLAAAGLNCAKGKLNFTGSPVTVQFGKLQDVTSAVGADKAVAIQATAPAYDVVLIGCQVGREDVLFSFLRTKSTPTSALPNPITIVQTAVQKIKNG